MKRRLLLVEDDEVFLRPLLRTLELKGYEVLPVQSGEEALEAVKAEDVDLVLTDRRLPGMDGVELVRQIKTEHPDLAVVVMRESDLRIQCGTTAAYIALCSAAVDTICVKTVTRRTVSSAPKFLCAEISNGNLRKLQRKIGRPACERSKTIDDFGRLPG